MSQTTGSASWIHHSTALVLTRQVVRTKDSQYSVTQQFTEVCGPRYWGISSVKDFWSVPKRSFTSSWMMLSSLPVFQDWRKHHLIVQTVWLRSQLATRMYERFRLRTDIVKSLSGESKFILLNRLFGDSVELPSWAKIIAKPKLYLGDTLSHRQGVAESPSSMARDLAKAGFPALGAYHLYARLAAATFHKDFKEGAAYVCHPGIAAILCCLPPSFGGINLSLGNAVLGIPGKDKAANVLSLLDARMMFATEEEYWAFLLAHASSERIHGKRSRRSQRPHQEPFVFRSRTT